MKNISTALVKAQKAFSPALKTSTNPHFRSKYADLSACVEAVIDSLNANGIALIQRNHECSDGVIVETVFIHESGEMLDAGKLHVPASKQDPQGYGSALTYARRYSLMAACGIAPEDDDGNAASKKSTVTALPAASKSITKSVWDELEPEEQNALQAIADEAIAIFTGNGTADTLAFLHSQGLNTDEKVAMFSRFDSKMRAALKKPQVVSNDQQYATQP